MSASQLTAEEDRWTEEFVAACKEKGFALKSRFEVGPQRLQGSLQGSLALLERCQRTDSAFVVMRTKCRTTSIKESSSAFEVLR
jgi:hypothetical protein